MSTPQIPQGFTVLQRRMAPSGAYLTACEGECARCNQRIVIDVSDDGTVITQSDDVNLCIHCCIFDDKRGKAEKREQRAAKDTDNLIEKFDIVMGDIGSPEFFVKYMPKL